ncbi:MAG: 3-dehydroquinate synthase [Candidatus Methanomethylophilaceae archaeon]|nr:3-dehydroquinate synthase [Candidatus Methanomethylophilaceae archaeon]MDI3541738.1 3-dehydroquinate synthase [Candidatus Methanomethylophilaceae archaeon]
MGKIWARADIPDDTTERKHLVTQAIERGIEDIVVREGDDSFETLGRVTMHYRKGDHIFSPWGKMEMVSIDSAEAMKKVMDAAGKSSFVVSTKDWKVIPLENLVAAFQNSDSHLVAVAQSLEEAGLFLKTLERGVDAVLLEPESWDDDEISDILLSQERIELRPVRVGGVRPLPLSDRVCVDTCSLMSPGEGMLVGSQSSCLLLIESESEESQYVASRPFRVNAGAVHAYVLTPGGKTRYLSELRGGDEVLLVNAKGESRRAVIGRCKIEKRPMLLIELEHEGNRYNAIVQNAETVRLVTPDGSISVSELRSGDEVLASVSSGGRHFGMMVDETIRET